MDCLRRSLGADTGTSALLSVLRPMRLSSPGVAGYQVIDGFYRGAARPVAPARGPGPVAPAHGPRPVAIPAPVSSPAPLTRMTWPKRRFGQHRCRMPSPDVSALGRRLIVEAAMPLTAV